jgi:actin
LGSGQRALISSSRADPMDDYKATVIIDNGSGHVKAGLVGDEKPCSVFPALVGRPKHGMMMPGGKQREHYLGDEATAMRGVLALSYPIEHGIVRDWADMEKIWHHTFYDALRINPEEHPMIVTEAPMNPLKNRERMVEMLFEKFSSPAVFVVIQAVMSLYSYGRTTGVVVDSGDGVTHVVPVYEGFCMPHAVQRMDLAGRDLSEYMVKVLTENGISMVSSAEREIVRDMKERCCFVCEDDYAATLKKAQERPTDFEYIYTLPDGNKVGVVTERFRVPEVLFDPMMVGKELMGIHQATYNCVAACDIDTRSALFNNIVLSGGTTLFPGIEKRLEKEVKALAPPKNNVKVVASPHRRYLVWMGASIVGQLSAFPDMLIWKSEYDQLGPPVVHRKCL